MDMPADMPGMTSSPPTAAAGGGGGGGSNMGHGGMMHMSFFWGDRAQILFSGWPGDRGVGVYLLALFIVAAAAAAGECLSAFCHRLAPPPSASTGSRAARALLRTAVHAVKMGLLYLVMLAVMSFNVGVLIAAVAGHTAGFLVAGSGAFRRARPRPVGPEAAIGHPSEKREEA